MNNSDSSDDVAQPVPNGKHVLVVDDYPAIARMIQVHLERNGYAVETADNGVEALATIKTSRPDLLITDIDMPEIDGLELIKAIRSDAALADLPIILMASKAADRPLPDIKYLLSRGANRVITKPFNPRELLAYVRALLDKPSTKDEQ
jgi:chemosensory pili system protein ChpA (sensor histidine kinase/response regulator)